MTVENDNEKVYEKLGTAITATWFEVKEFGKCFSKHWGSTDNIFINDLAFEAFKKVSAAGDIYATIDWQQARKIKLLSTAYNNITTILKLYNLFETNLSEKRFNSTDKHDYETVVKELKIVSKRLDKTAKLLNDVIKSEMNVYVKFCTSPKASPYDDADDNHD